MSNTFYSGHESVGGVGGPTYGSYVGAGESALYNARPNGVFFNSEVGSAAVVGGAGGRGTSGQTDQLLTVTQAYRFRDISGLSFASEIADTDPLWAMNMEYAISHRGHSNGGGSASSSYRNSTTTTTTSGLSNTIIPANFVQLRQICQFAYEEGVKNIGAGMKKSNLGTGSMIGNNTSAHEMVDKLLDLDSVYNFVVSNQQSIEHKDPMNSMDPTVMSVVDQSGTGFSDLWLKKLNQDVQTLDSLRNSASTSINIPGQHAIDLSVQPQAPGANNGQTIEAFRIAFVKSLEEKFERYNKYIEADGGSHLSAASEKGIKEKLAYMQNWYNRFMAYMHPELVADMWRFIGVVTSSEHMRTNTHMSGPSNSMHDAAILNAANAGGAHGASFLGVNNPSAVTKSQSSFNPIVDGGGGGSGITSALYGSFNGTQATAYRTGRSSQHTLTTYGYANMRNITGTDTFDGGLVSVVLSRKWDSSKNMYTYVDPVAICDTSYISPYYTEPLYGMRDSASPHEHLRTDGIYAPSVYRIGRVFQSTMDGAGGVAETSSDLYGNAAFRYKRRRKMSTRDKMSTSTTSEAKNLYQSLGTSVMFLEKSTHSD